MKALIIGGTGVISESISELLIERGHQLFLLNRGNRSLPPGAISLVADINDEEAVTALLSGQQFDVVADFIAYLPKDLERDLRLFRNKTNQFIFISSASAYQKPLNNPFITEETPLDNPFWQYSRDKIECEKYLMKIYNDYGFPVTIVRPSHTYSSRNVPVALHGKNGNWQILKRIIDGKPILIHGDGTSLWTLTHSRDFANAFVGIMNNSSAIGEAVHITSDESLTWNQIHQAIADALGAELNALHVPSSLLVTAGHKFGYDFEGALLGDKANSVIFDNSKIKRLVPEYKASIPFSEGVRESVRYMLSHPELHREDPDYDAFCDHVASAMEAVNRCFN